MTARRGRNCIPSEDDPGLGPSVFSANGTSDGPGAGVGDATAAGSDSFLLASRVLSALLLLLEEPLGCWIGGKDSASRKKHAKEMRRPNTPRHHTRRGVELALPIVFASPRKFSWPARPRRHSPSSDRQGSYTSAGGTHKSLRIKFFVASQDSLLSLCISRDEVYTRSLIGRKTRIPAETCR